MFPQSKMGQAAPDNVPTETVEGKVDLSTVNWDEQVDKATNSESTEWNEIPAPPAEGIKLIKVSLFQGEKTMSKQFSNKVGGYLGGFIACEMVNAEDEGYTFNYYLNSIVNQKKGTSELHFLCALAGEVIPKGLKIPAMEEFVNNVLGGNPVVSGLWKWIATYFDDSPTAPKGRVNQKGWITQVDTMYKFPKDAEAPSGYSHFIPSRLDGTMLVARGHLEGFLTTADAAKYNG